MSAKTYKILVVEPQPDLLEVLVASLAGHFNAHITCVASASACLDIEIVTPHHLVIANAVLDDSDGYNLADKLLALSHRPVILMAAQPTAEEAIVALRLGVADLLCKPFPIALLLDAAERALRGQETHRQHAVKFSRMRDLVRRAIRERRDLNNRVELLCKDFIGAHRRLAHKMIDLMDATPNATGQADIKPR